eukprot:11805238-Karenia_brevis.AAC.1
MLAQAPKVCLVLFEPSSLSSSTVLLQAKFFVWSVSSAPKTPAYGWCHGSHRPRKPAQSGYADSKGNRYCKECFKFKCPR